MSNILTQTQAAIQEANDSVLNFLKKFHVGDLLRKCRASKAKGFPVIEIFRYLLSCMFVPYSTYMSMRTGTYKEAFSKNTIYRFCDDAAINWHRFVRLLSEQVISTFLRPATSENRTEYFIIDDTPFAKSGRKTELVSKATPHNAARADAERKRVLIKAFFRRNTLCISRKNDEIRARVIRQMPQTHCAVLP